MNMITPEHNFDNGYIGLVNLQLKPLPDKVLVEEYELLKKSEFHISVMCVKRIAKIISAENPDRVQQEIVDYFVDNIDRLGLIEYELTGELRLVKSDSRVTLVGMTVLNNIEAFFDEISEKYSTELPLQPTHITLYTLQPDAGIGILSQEQLHEQSKPVTMPLQIEKA